MAAGNFYLPFVPVQGGNGFVVPGALVTFYAAGTTTKVPIYADEALSVSLPNPVEADGTGKLPAIYLSDALYHVRITDALGALLNDIDSYAPGDYPKGDPGPTGSTGPANSTYLTKAAVTSAAATTNQSAILADPSQGGTFAYQSGNFTARLTADTTRGVYIPAQGDPNGTTRAWVRIGVGEWVKSEWFGAGWPGVVAAYAAGFDKVEMPAGSITRTSDLHIVRPVWGLRGAGQGKTTVLIPNDGIVAYADGTPIKSLEAYGFDLALTGPAGTSPAFALGVFNIDCAGNDVSNVDIHHIGGSIAGHIANFTAIVAHGGNVVRNCGVRACSVKPGLRMFAEFVQHDAPTSPNAMVGMYVEDCDIERVDAAGINILVSFSGAMTGCRTRGNRFAGGGGTAVALEFAGNHVSGEHEAWFDGNFAVPGGFMTVTPNIQGSATTGTRIRPRFTPGVSGRFLLAADKNLQIDTPSAIPPEIIIERTSLSQNAAAGPFPEFDGSLYLPADKIKVTMKEQGGWSNDVLEVTVAGIRSDGGANICIRKTIFMGYLSGGTLGMQAVATEVFKNGDALVVSEQGATLTVDVSSPLTITLGLSGVPSGTFGINWHVKALRRGAGILIGKA